MFDLSWFLNWIEQLTDSPVQQAILAALSTFILEDPTSLGCGLLVADGKMAFLTAFIGLLAGISLGDFGLYLAGRFLGPKVLRWGLVTAARLKTAEEWFDRNLATAVIFSRFVPGMRLPTYVGAGVLRAPMGKFVSLAVGATVVWTLLLLSLTVELGEAFLPLLGRWKLPLALLFLALIVTVQWVLARRKRPPSPKSGNYTSFFEFWPPYLFYIPVVFYYLSLVVRYRSLTLPTAANPSVFAGGLIGESKAQILDLIPPEQAHWLAPFLHFGANGAAWAQRASEIEEEMSRAGLDFPVVAKPDQGQRGAGVQPITSSRELLDYLRHFPDQADLLIQELVDAPREAGILFYRLPETSQGTIFSVTLKSFPRVTGDGTSTLEELIEKDPRASRISQVYFERHLDRLDWVPAAGEEVQLVFSGNHCQGAVFEDGTHLVTQRMLERFQEIVSSLPEFYFGRFDVRFDSLSGLTRGEGFRIIELNGAGAEATHIWDARYRLRDAYRVLFRQFRVLFEIGAQNRRRGHRPTGIFRLTRSTLRYWKISRDYPPAL